jgi:hypothetical protein
MTERDIRQTLDMARERDARLDSWLRYLVGLASGALTVLVSLQKDTPQPEFPSVCLRVAWGTLGLGILLGSVALYGHVFQQRGLVKRWVADRGARTEDEAAGESPSPTTGPSMRVFQWAERLCYSSLIVAVVALVSFALTRV